MNAQRKNPIRPFAARRTVVLPTAVLAVTAVIGVTGPAGAASRAPSSTTSVTFADGLREGMAAGAVIPEGFLLFESKETRKRIEKKFVHTPMRWKVTDRLKVPLLIDPCDRGKPSDEHRRAVRTITGRSVTWDGDHSEQLIVYRDEKAARAAFRGLRSDIRRCDARTRDDYRVKDTHVGDEAFMADIFKVASFERATVMRQGRTVAIYARPGDGLPPKWRGPEYGGVEAGKMARKLAATPL